jgi:hypothetical protein
VKLGAILSACAVLLATGVVAAQGPLPSPEAPVVDGLPATPRSATSQLRSPPTPPWPGPEPPLTGLRLAGFVLIGLGGAGMFTGLVMGAASRCGLAAEPRTPPCTQFEIAHDGVLWAGTIVAGASGAAGIYGGFLVAVDQLVALRGRRTTKVAPRASRAVPAVVPSLGGAALKWTF